MMNDKLNLYNIILAPLNTEKSRPQDNSIEKQIYNKYVFKVLKSATKQQIKEAFEYCFNKQVEKVNVLNVDGKIKTFKQKSGKRASWKKAYITLKLGQKLDLYHN